MASIASTASPNEQLFAAAEAGNVEAITNLCTQSGAEPYYQEEVHGESVLMRAAAHGQLAAVKVLLELGAPWNAVDRMSRCAGTFALKNGHQEIVNWIVDIGVASEIKFAAIEREQKKQQQTASISSSNIFIFIFSTNHHILHYLLLLSARSRHHSIHNTQWPDTRCICQSKTQIRWTWCCSCISGRTGCWCYDAMGETSDGSTCENLMYV